MNTKKTNLFILIIITMLIFTSQPGFGMGKTNTDTKVYIIVVNKLSLLDIENMPNLNRLIDDGSIGLMNTRGLSGYSGGEGFATINASGKSYADSKSSQFHNLNEEYKEIYENRMGVLNGEYAIGNIQMGKLYNQNEKNRYSPYIGALGDTLHRAQLKTAVFGNSDIEETEIRFSALIPMDSRGLVDYGNLDSILIEDIDYPYGFKTDYEKIFTELAEIEDNASLVVIDTGDLYRLNIYGDYLSLDVFEQKRNMILKDIDNFIGDLTAKIEKENSLLMVISPNRAEERIDGSRLTPIVLWGKGVGNGVLTSSTTNKKGIVTNLDISPTILKALNISTNNISGSSMRTLKESRSVEYIKSINERINTSNKVRTKTLSLYGIISIIIMFISLILFILNISINNDIGQFLKKLLLSLYAIPMVLILNSLFNINSIFKFVISLFVFISILVLIIKKYDAEKIISIITIIYFILIIIDLLSNNYLTRFSILSYDPIIGARYFGIGNEMIGIFLAITAIMSGLLLERFSNRAFSIFILLISILFVGHPKLGANIGGTMALVFASFYFILLKKDRQFSFKNIIIAIVLIGVIIVGLAYIDIYLNPNPTHLGKSLILLSEDGLGIVQNIINRKVLMNIKLTGSTIWTKVLFVNILVQITISYVFKEEIEKILDNGLGKGILTGILGAIVGLLLNESGIILSALAMNLITIFLLITILKDLETFKEEVD